MTKINNTPALQQRFLPQLQAAGVLSIEQAPPTATTNSALNAGMYGSRSSSGSGSYSGGVCIDNSLDVNTIPETTFAPSGSSSN